MNNGKTLAEAIAEVNAEMTRLFGETGPTSGGLGAEVATYYHTLVGDAVPAELAAELTLAFQTELVSVALPTRVLDFVLELPDGEDDDA